jgi:hypothetical protein
MRRIGSLLIVSAALCAACLESSAASAAEFAQCPPVYKDTGCKFLIVVTNAGVSVQEDPTQEPFYEGEDDTLFGIENESSAPITKLPLSAPNDIFGFDEDGICNPGGLPVPPGCVVLAKNAKGEPTHGEVTPGGGTKCEVQDGACGFEPPPDEPLGTTFATGIAGFASNGIAVTGYEGPTSWFSNLSSEFNSGIVNFDPAIAPGGSTYFGLEEAPSVLIGSPATLSTILSGGGQAGSSITVVQGTPVVDTGTLAGAGASVATGSITYTVYSNPECTTVAAAAGSGGVSAGSAPSPAISNLSPGTYYWRASYPGDINNQAVSSTCGAEGEVLTVQAPTTTTTIQTGGGVIGASIPVLKGSAVTDLAHIAGAEAASATGTVTYTLYKEAKCKVALTSSVASVTGGVAGSSAPVNVPVGTYYWVASYSGGGLNAPSASACGSEQLIVSTKTNLGLPNGKKCFSKRDFAIHPRFPKGAKIVSYEEFINGTLAKKGKLNKSATSVDLVGLPKGAYKVELLTFTASGASYEDTRTFHTCVPKKHKKHH